MAGTTGNPQRADRRRQLVWLGQAVGLLVVAASLGFSSVDRDEKTLLKIDYHARHEKWPEVLAGARRLPARRYRVTTRWDVNRALFHTDRLGYDMFAYPQEPASILISNADSDVRQVPRRAWAKLGRIYLELGRVAEAQFRTHEAMEHLGERPWIIDQVFLIYVIKRQADPARIALNALGRHLLWRDRAREYRRRMAEDPFLSQDDRVEHIRSVMIVEDHLGHVTVETMLQQLLARNRHNRMAFEYLMAYYLLTRQLEHVVSEMDRLNDFDYPDIPRHYEEAILLHTKSNEDQDVDLHGRQISEDTRQRFEAFFELYDRHRGDTEAAQEALVAEFADSYFFYYVFGVTGYEYAFARSAPVSGAWR